MSARAGVAAEDRTGGEAVGYRVIDIRGRSPGAPDNQERAVGSLDGVGAGPGGGAQNGAGGVRSPRSPTRCQDHVAGRTRCIQVGADGAGGLKICLARLHQVKGPRCRRRRVYCNRRSVARGQGGEIGAAG